MYIFDCAYFWFGFGALFTILLGTPAFLQSHLNIYILLVLGLQNRGTY